MIEEELFKMILNYGVLGIWTISLLIDKRTFQKNIGRVIETNTGVLRQVKNIINKRR